MASNKANTPAEDCEGTNTRDIVENGEEGRFAQQFLNETILLKYTPGEEMLPYQIGTRHEENRNSGSKPEPTTPRHNSQNNVHHTANSSVDDAKGPRRDNWCYLRQSEVEDNGKILCEEIMALLQAWSQRHLEEKKKMEQVWKLVKLCEIGMNMRRATNNSKESGHWKRTNSKSASSQTMKQPAGSYYHNEAMYCTQEKPDLKRERKTNNLLPRVERSKKKPEKTL